MPSNVPHRCTSSLATRKTRSSSQGLRAVLGGTGEHNGVTGQLTSTRNTDGTYKQEFSLTKP